MNKFVIYTVIAILLGTVTMIAPLAVLEHNQQLNETEMAFADPEPEAQKLKRNDTLSATDTPNKTLNEDDFFDSVPEEPQIIDAEWTLTDTSSSLASIGLMIVPSFLIALGVFAYTKKRTK